MYMHAQAEAKVHCSMWQSRRAPLHMLTRRTAAREACRAHCRTCQQGTLRHVADRAQLGLRCGRAYFSIRGPSCRRLWWSWPKPCRVSSAA